MKNFVLAVVIAVTVIAVIGAFAPATAQARTWGQYWQDLWSSDRIDAERQLAVTVALTEATNKFTDVLKNIIFWGSLVLAACATTGYFYGRRGFLPKKEPSKSEERA